MSFRRVLVLGGARSGKSTFAERLAAESGQFVVYVATATAGDDEMAERIAQHRAQRPPTWRTLEIPVGVAQGVAAALSERVAAAGHGDSGAGENQSLFLSTSDTLRAAVTIVVEDLTLLLSNLLAVDESRAEAAALQELRALFALPADLILVSNEVGMGLVPPYPLGRRFRDALGRTNQAAAAGCDAVFVLFAGLPLQLK